MSNLTKAALLLLALAAGCLAGGCMSRGRLLEDVHNSRVQSYEQWLSIHRSDSGSETKLKGALSLEDALKVSLVNSKPLQAVLEERAKATGTIVESYGEILPTVKALGSYTRLERLSSFSVGGSAVSLGSLDNYSATLEVTQPLYRGGAISSALRAARVFALLSDELVRAEIQQVIFNVALAYYDVLLAQELYKVNDEAVKTSERFLEDIRKKVKGGVATRYDELRAEVELSNFKAERIQQRNIYNRATTRLLKAMGVSQDSAVELSDALKHVPVSVGAEEAVRTAFENRPDLFQQELDVRLQREAVNVAMSGYFPRFDAFFDYIWAKPNPVNRVVEWGRTWQAGLTLEWVLFDGLRREGQLMQDRASLRQKMINLKDAEENALREIQATLLSIDDAEQFVESQSKNVDLASEGLRLVRVGYEQGGINTEVEVYDAQSALTRAQGFYYQAVYSYMIARLGLQLAMGTLGPSPGFKGKPQEARLPESIVPAGAGAKPPAPPEQKSDEGK